MVSPVCQDGVSATVTSNKNYLAILTVIQKNVKIKCTFKMHIVANLFNCKAKYIEKTDKQKVLRLGIQMFNFYFLYN